MILPLELLKRMPELDSIPNFQAFAFNAALLVCCSLYISSCCRTTLKALLISLPLAGALLLALEFLRQNDEQLLRVTTTITSFEMAQRHSGFQNSTLRLAPPFELWTALLAPYVCLALVLFLLLRFACRNHFSAEHGRPQRAGQLLWLSRPKPALILSASVCFGI